MLDGILGGFLGDAIEVIGHDVIADRHRFWEVATAAQLKGALDTGSEFFQSGHQPLGDQFDRVQAMGQAVGLLNGLVKLSFESPGIASLGQRFPRQFMLEESDLELGGSEQLANPVVQIPAQSFLLLLDGAQDSPLEQLGFADVVHDDLD